MPSASIPSELAEGFCDYAARELAAMGYTNVRTILIESRGGWKLGFQ
jgi:hypothetical protein